MGLLLQKKKTKDKDPPTTTHPEENKTSTTNTSIATFPYTWFLLQQICRVKSHIQAITIAMQRIKQGKDIMEITTCTKMNDESYDNDNTTAIIHDTTRQGIQDEIHNLMDKVESISKIMMQMERILNGQKDVPITAHVDPSATMERIP